mgnify:CR=1 FL=1
MRSLKFLILFLLIASCSDHDYIPFEEFQFEEARIADQAEVRILSFSGGKKCTTTETYYYSVIAIVIGTEDTIRILSPCQLFSQKYPTGTFHLENNKKDSLLAALGFDFYDASIDQIVVVTPELPFQKIDYKTIVGSIGFDDEAGEIIKDDLKRKNIDTLLLELPRKIIP